MQSHSVYKRIENEAARRARRAGRWSWRQWRWGQVRLSAREAEALRLELQFMTRPAVDKSGNPIPIQRAIAQRMGCSQQWVSRLLQNASDIFLYFVEHNIPARWCWNGRYWVLEAPIANIEAEG